METFRQTSCSQTRPSIQLRAVSETDCRSVQATALRELTADCPAISCYCNCTQTYSFAPHRPSSERETESFSSIQPTQIFGSVLLGGGDLLGRRRGVIEVTKRGEVNIPDIPGCCCWPGYCHICQQGLLLLGPLFALQPPSKNMIIPNSIMLKYVISVMPILDERSIC